MRDDLVVAPAAAETAPREISPCAVLPVVFALLVSCSLLAALGRTLVGTRLLAGAGGPAGVAVWSGLGVSAMLAGFAVDRLARSRINRLDRCRWRQPGHRRPLSEGSAGWETGLEAGQDGKGR